MRAQSENEIENPAEKLLHDLKEVVHDGEELLKVGAHGLSEKGMEAREKLSAALKSARETAHRLQERAVAARRSRTRSSASIRINPVASRLALGC
jgi:ElaB/YqjD/DUF883 family membrane-anchored ribosome-binding protein